MTTTMMAHQLQSNGASLTILMPSRKRSRDEFDAENNDITAIGDGNPRKKLRITMIDENVVLHSSMKINNAHTSSTSIPKMKSITFKSKPSSKSVKLSKSKNSKKRLFEETNIGKDDTDTSKRSSPSKKIRLSPNVSNIGWY